MMTWLQFWVIALVISGIGCGASLSRFQHKRCKESTVLKWTFAAFGCACAVWAYQFGG